ncbi:MAG: phosphate acyltransferase PlsX [Clostridiales bacterium]|nr:phosphate acyltransferase PlsX [Clostridiales bacterium]
MKIAIDGMGGDHAPGEIVKGCLEALKQISHEIYIIGDEQKIQNELNKYTYNKEKVAIVHTTEIITSEDQPVKSIRSKNDSSMVVGMNMVKNGEVDVFISAGNTGALMAGALFILGRIPGIDRPALASVYPNPAMKKACLLVDAGANAECKVNNLVEFAIMGSIYCEKVLNIENPRVGLVNIGTEDEKGTKTVKDAYKIMKKTDLNFIGNVEARELQNNICDVIVCDGFVGNVILKLSEGVALTFVQLLKNKISESFLAKAGALIMYKKLKELKTDLDYSEYGGAPILGVKGAIVKIHGNSESNAVKNAILKAIPYVENNVVSIIHDEVVKYHELEQKEDSDE